MVASIPLPCTARSRPASARKDPGEATEGSAAVVSSSDRLLLEPSSLRTAALCTGAGSLPLDTGIGTHDHLGAALATSQIAPRGRSLIGLLQRSILTESIALRQKSISSGRKAGLASSGRPAGWTHRAGRGDAECVSLGPPARRLQGISELRRLREFQDLRRKERGLCTYGRRCDWLPACTRPRR